MGVFSRTSFEFAKVLSTELMYYIDFLSLFAEATSEGASQKVADRMVQVSCVMVGTNATAAAATRYTYHSRGEDKKKAFRQHHMSELLFYAAICAHLDSRRGETLHNQLRHLLVRRYVAKIVDISRFILLTTTILDGSFIVSYMCTSFSNATESLQMLTCQMLAGL